MVLRLFIRCSALIVASCFLFLSAFEASLALETPIAGKAYSDVSDDEDMVVMLRCASVIASILWLFAAVIFVHHSGLVDCGLSSDISTLTAWGISAGWSVCSVLYVAPAASADRWTLYHPYPITLLLAATCLFITYHGHPEEFEEEPEDETIDEAVQVSDAKRQKELREPLLAHIGVQVV